MSTRRVAKGFSRLAGVYDILALCAFGGAIQRAQRRHAGEIASWERALIVGGGTGHSLDALLACEHHGRIWYVDCAPGMIAMARKRLQKGRPEAARQVTFICGTIDDLPENLRFDLICTHFFLDVFGSEALAATMAQLDKRLCSGGLWLFADFRYADSKAAYLLSFALIQSLYLFFRMCCGIEARRLPGMNAQFAHLGYAAERHDIFAFGLIEAIAFRKTSGRIVDA